jgi:signal transduction histidine kinase
MTERRRLEAERLKLTVDEERLSVIASFVQSASHDLRNPLAVIGTSAYLIGRKLSTDERQRVELHLNTIDEQVSHLNRQLENLLTLAKTANLRHEMAMTPFDFKALVSDVLEEYTRKAEENGLRVVEAQPDSSLPVHADEGELRRALRHLLTNALHYTPAGGFITVTTAADRRQIVFTVSDTGIGIAPEDLPRIFDPFYRADPARQIDSGGMGLGLSVVKMIVEAHNGQIAVQSQPGIGSSFTLSLPIVANGEKSSRPYPQYRR